VIAFHQCKCTPTFSEVGHFICLLSAEMLASFDVTVCLAVAVSKMTQLTADEATVFEFVGFNHSS